MKLAIISDIHGNYEALKVVLKEIDAIGVDQTVCLGDVVGYYCQVNEVCDTLRQREIKSIMGNHDWYVAGGGFCPRSKSVNDCLEYQRKILTRENTDWLRSLPIQMQVGNIKMVHGGWANPIDEYLVRPNKEYFDKVEGEVFMSGHTHVQGVYDFGDKVYCNPGSVGQPRDGDPRAAFAVFDGAFHCHRVDYDFEKLFALMDAAGFSDYYYGGLKTGAKNLRKLSDGD